MRGKTGKKRARSATSVRHTRRMKRKGTERKIKSADSFPYSPISSPGSPGSPVSVNSPITHRAKELARMYPNRKAMLQRSTSFQSTGMTNAEFYAELEKLIGTENVPYSPKRRV
jgi:hypothetical protein